MCLAIPGKVLNVDGDDPAFLSGKVDFGGIRKEIRFAFTPEVRPGDYVLVHVGFALRVIDEVEAERNRATIAEMLEEFGTSLQGEADDEGPVRSESP
ncbi:MAG: HypC/HybG/HupF family hydrogenase formation chaperone [Bryobacterales bacterium]|nr:HypC/HybG/HupF family hydrogenase formation chaperone [Bryobacterales bacterium]